MKNCFAVMYETLFYPSRKILIIIPYQTVNYMHYVIMDCYVLLSFVPMVVNVF